MQEKSELDLIKLFREIQISIAKYGLSAVTEQLKGIHKDENYIFRRDVCDYILIITSNRFLVKKEDILNSKKRGLISEARRMCFALIKEHLPLTDKEIGIYFGGRSRQFVNKELVGLPINQTEFRTKQESKFVEDFLYLTKKVLIYKNKNSVE